MKRLLTTRRKPARLARLILFTSAVLSILAGTFLYWLHSREPVHHGKTVTQWVDQLSTNRKGGYYEAETALRELGPAAVPVLKKRLKSREGGITDIYSKVSPHLPKNLRDRAREIVKPHDRMMKQINAAQALELLGTNGASAISELGDVMRRENVAVASSAATALGQMGEAAVPELIATLDQKDYIHKSHACLALRRIGSRAGAAAPKLGEMLENGSWQEVTLAAMTLGAIGEPAIPVLIEKLESTNALTRMWAANAISQTHAYGNSAVPALLKQTGDPDEKVRAEAIAALLSVDLLSPEVDAVILKALDDPKLEVRRKVLQALGGRCRPSAIRTGIPKLASLLNDPDAETRALAAICIGCIGEHASAAIPQLQAALQDSNPKVKIEAQRALAQIKH